MKRILIVCILLMFLPISCYAEADASEVLLDEYTELYGDVFEKSIRDLELGDSFLELVPGFRIRDLLEQLVEGRLEFSFPEIFRGVLKYLSGEVYQSIKLLVIVLGASVMCSCLTGLKSGFGEQGVTRAAYYACYLIIAGTAATAFYHTADCVTQGISDMAYFMEMMVPVVITTLVTSGAVVSASVFEPLLLSVVGIGVRAVQTIFVPLVMTSTAMSLASGASEQFKMQKLIKFMNQCVKWGLSVMLTVFVTVSGLQSIASGGVDGISVKLTKFAAANLIPVVGGILAESVETVMNCSVIIKNSVGILGILCLIAIGVIPLLKVAAILIVFRLTAAIAEPVSEPKIITCLTELANGVAVLFSMLAAVAVMFVVVLTVVIHAGNTAVMLGR